MGVTSVLDGADYNKDGDLNDGTELFKVDTGSLE
jgi:hypothetical protein